MKFRFENALFACVAGLVLTACGAPTLVSLQPIGAPQPTNAQQTFVDADGCSWWIIGNGSDLRWAPMTSSSGEHVCDGGATRIDPRAQTATASTDGDSLVDDLGDAIDETTTEVPTATAATQAPSAAAPVADSRAYYVQVATFARESNIVASESLFRSLGYKIESGSGARGNDRLYRLVLGPFSNKDEAQKAVEQSFNEGFDDAFPFRR